MEKLELVILKKLKPDLCWITWTLVDKEKLSVCCTPSNTVITTRNEACDTVE